MKKYIIGFALVVLSIGGIFHLMDWSYNTAKEDQTKSCNNRVNHAISLTKNQMVLEYQVKLENALKSKEIEYKNWEYATAECPVIIESNVVELCDCPVGDYEDMISDRDEKILDLEIKIRNYQNS